MTSVRAGTKTTRAFANQEQERSLLVYERLTRSLCVLIASVFSILVIALFIIDHFFHQQNYVLDEVKVTGKLEHISPQEVVSAVSAIALGNFFSVDLSKVKQSVEALDWVRSADVRREWPNRVSVYVQEQQPMMQWGGEHSKQWVNSQGKVVELEGQIKAPYDIVLSGDEQSSVLMLDRVLKWLPLFEQHDLHIAGLHLSASQAWRITLKDIQHDYAFDLLLGSEHLDQRIQRFLLLHQQHLHNAENKVMRVDTRYPNGLAVKLGGIKEKKSPIAPLAIGDSLTQLQTDN